MMLFEYAMQTIFFEVSLLVIIMLYLMFASIINN